MEYAWTTSHEWVTVAAFLTNGNPQINTRPRQGIPAGRPQPEREPGAEPGEGARCRSLQPERHAEPNPETAPRGAVREGARCRSLGPERHAEPARP